MKASIVVSTRVRTVQLRVAALVTPSRVLGRGIDEPYEVWVNGG